MVRPRLVVRGVAVLVCLGLASACGSSSGGGDDSGNPDAGPGDSLEGLVSVTISPTEATLYAEGVNPAVQVYTVIGTFDDGTTRDVSERAAFSLDSEDAGLGRFTGPSFATSNRSGGRTTVKARIGIAVATSALTVVIRQRTGDPSVPDLPADPGGPFGGPSSDARAPTLLYPNDGVLLPPNLGRLEIHFYPGTGATAGSSNQLFAIDFTSAVTDVTVYTRCVNPLNSGCIYRPTDEVWRWIADSNRGDTTGIKIKVRGTDDAGTGVGASGQISAGFSHDDIRGGIFYWTTSTRSVMTFDFASTQTEPQVFIDQRLTGYADPALTDTPDEQRSLCGVGCHALSRDGKKLVTAVGRGSFDARTLLVDVERRETKVFAPPAQSAFFSWGPDGSQYVGTFGGGPSPGYNLNLFNGDTGLVEGEVAVGGTATAPITHPDWAADGSRIAFTRVGVRAAGETSTTQRIYRSTVAVVERTGGAWGTPVALTASAAGKASYYPAFSPQSDLIVFNKSACATADDGAGCDCYDDPSAALWITRPEAGATPVELAKANQPGLADIGAGKTFVQSSYPKWSPFTFRRTGEFGSRLHWVTFSSNRNYGLYAPPVLGTGETNTLLWMAAVDPDAALGGSDPSYPAFALPFQDITTDNHTAQWAERVIPEVE